ncbi:hypothetical protein ACDI16_12425 [Oceanobacillus caeni]
MSTLLEENDLLSLEAMKEIKIMAEKGEDPGEVLEFLILNVLGESATMEEKYSFVKGYRSCLIWTQFTVNEIKRRDNE